MSFPGILQIVVYAVLIILVTKPLGLHMWRVVTGERTFLTPVLGPLERVIYRLTGVQTEVEQGRKGYAFAMLIFSVVGGLLTSTALTLVVVPILYTLLMKDQPSTQTNIDLDLAEESSNGAAAADGSGRLPVAVQESGLPA